MVDALTKVTLIEGGKYHVLVLSNVTQRYAKGETMGRQTEIE